MIADGHTRTLIRAYVVERFPEVSNRRLADEDSLLESGVVDSLGMLELATFIEERFGLALQDEHFTPENFDNISAIARFVDDLR